MSERNNVINLSEYRLERFARELEGFTTIQRAANDLVNKLEAEQGGSLPRFHTDQHGGGNAVD